MTMNLHALHRETMRVSGDIANTAERLYGAAIELEVASGYSCMRATRSNHVLLLSQYVISLAVTEATITDSLRAIGVSQRTLDDVRAKYNVLILGAAALKAEIESELAGGASDDVQYERAKPVTGDPVLDAMFRELFGDNNGPLDEIIVRPAFGGGVSP